MITVIAVRVYACVHVYEINQTCLVFLNILRSDHVWCCLLCRMCACRLAVVCESQLGSRQLMRRQSKKRKWTECPRKDRAKSFLLWRTGSYSKKCLHNLPSKCNNFVSQETLSFAQNIRPPQTFSSLRMQSHCDELSEKK